MRARRMIEAALDPRGKWYGLGWPDQPAVPAPDVEPAEQEEAIAGDRDVEAVSWALRPNGRSWDEWEPA